MPFLKRFKTFSLHRSHKIEISGPTDLHEMSREGAYCYADFDPVEKSMPGQWPRIYLFGDSLTERAFYNQTGGFGVMLRDYYEGKGVGVLNRGKVASVMAVGLGRIRLHRFQLTDEWTLSVGVS